MYGVVPFSAEDLQAAIPVLELLTIIVSLFTLYERIQGVALCVLSDSLTSIQAMANGAHREEMQFLHRRLVEEPVYSALVEHGLYFGHLRGEGNPFADLLSRGRMDEFFQLCIIYGWNP